MNRRSFFVSAFAALFWPAKKAARAERIIVVNGWILRESDV